MNIPDTTELKHIDPEDIGDVLLKVEKSFGFQFGKTELKDVKTFGELCDIITNKVQGDHSDDCTTQQAFYKIRTAIAVTLCIDSKSITVDTRLEELFLLQQRRRQFNAVEKLLGLRMNVLRPKHWITTTFGLLLIVSFIGLFIYWQVGLSGLIFSIAILKISSFFGKELDLLTVEELADKMAREHYNKARRKPSTVNRKEVTQKIQGLFMADLGLERKVLTKDATFGWRQSTAT